MTKRERYAQNLRLKKRIGKTKCIAIAILIMMVVGIASAAYLQFFGNVTTTVNADQSVLLDGMSFHEPIEHEFDVKAGDEKCFEHWLLNQGCQTAWVNTSTTGIPDLEGIDVTFYTTTYDELIFPIEMEPGERINFTICYEFDRYLEGNITYEITTLFTTPYY